MKTKSFLIFTVFSICVIALVNLSHAIQVTQNAYEDAFPHMDGNYLVWQGKVGGDWEIFLYDIGSSQALQITDNGYNDISPQTDGTYVTWVGYSKAGGEILLYEISTGTTTAVTNDDAIDNPPKIADGRVVWSSHMANSSVEPGEVFLYDIQTTTQTNLSQTPNLDDSSPQINSETVTWIQTNGSETTTFVYENGTTSQAPEGFVWNDSPQRDGDLVVSTAHDRHDREIFLRDTSLDTRRQLTENGVVDTSPCISGAKIAWVCGSGTDAEILLLRDETEYEDYLADGFTAVGLSEFDPPPPEPGDGPNDDPVNGNNGGGSNGGGGGGGSCFISTVGWRW